MIEELQNEYDALLQRARPSAAKYRLQTERSDDGAPHVEMTGTTIDFVTTERGLELARRSFASKDDFLYAAISLDTFWMGVDYEFKHRIESQDARRMIFARQIELLNLIDPVWARRRSIEIDAILVENPYLDGGGPI